MFYLLSRIITYPILITFKFLINGLSNAVLLTQNFIFWFFYANGFN